MTDMRKRVHKKIFFYSCLLLAFFLPVWPAVLPVITIVMAINWAVSGTYIEVVPEFTKERWRIHILAFISLYILYLAGMFYTSDYANGWFDLEVKLSLLIFPVIFATSDLRVFDHTRLRVFYGSFIAGCLSGSLILLGHAWMGKYYQGVADAFYYTNLGWYFHPGYLAMYYTFAAGMVLYHLSADFSGRPDYKNIFCILVVLWLQVMLFLLSSKAGLLMFGITEMLFILLLLLQKVVITRVLLVATVMTTVFLLCARIFPFAFERVLQAKTAISSSKSVLPDSYDGTTARMEIWKVSFSLVKKHPLFGVGTGDVKAALLAGYQQNHLYPVVQKKLNAHNQYFQTFIAIGLTGIVVLVALFLIPLYGSFRRGDYLYALLILIFSFNILFESMLETQAGVVFYAFFNAFLFATGARNKAGNRPFHEEK
jgi:O-antigen ligase